MENPPQATPQTAKGLITIWCLTAVSNFLAFTSTVSLDDLQKFFAIVASIVVTVVTIATYFKKKK